MPGLWCSNFTNNSNCLAMSSLRLMRFRWVDDIGCHGKGGLSSCNKTRFQYQDTVSESQEAGAHSFVARKRGP
jgi:hypothetical protein